MRHRLRNWKYGIYLTVPKKGRAGRERTNTNREAEPNGRHGDLSGEREGVFRESETRRSSGGDCEHGRLLCCGYLVRVIGDVTASPF